MVKCLIDPVTHSVVAKLHPDKKIKISDKGMLESLTASGIVVSREFKELYRVGWRVYPTDAEEVFAKAFEQFYFIHGLQQQGYVWKSKADLKIPKEELAKMVLAHFQASKASK